MGRALRIIPVLDLKGGEVVRAQMGQRDSYKPIVTPLSASSDAVAVAEGLRTLFPFPTFYIADLDAIEGREPNTAALARLRAMPDAPELWVDAGIADAQTLTAALAEPSLCPVLGSESQRDVSLLKRFRDHPGLILSLDFFGDGFRGPPAFPRSARSVAGQGDRHDAGERRGRRRSGFRAARGDQAEGRKPLRDRCRRGARRGRSSARCRRSASRRRWSPPRSTTARSRPGNSRRSAH